MNRKIDAKIESYRHGKFMVKWQAKICLNCSNNLGPQVVCTKKYRAYFVNFGAKNLR